MVFTRWTFFGVVICLALASLCPKPAQAIAPEFKLGIGENVRRQDPPGGATYLGLNQSLVNRGVSTDFITHWFHPGWKNAFPATGVVYLAGYCNSGPEFNNLQSYQDVLDAGKRLVIVWWWHQDMPCDLTKRTDAENTLRDCLVPMITALHSGEVYVVLQPEYNRYDTCNAYQDASWSTHISTMMTQIHGISKPGLTVKTGPAVGDWAYDRSAYQVEGSLGACMPAADFVAYHEIYRQNSDHPAPNDTDYGNASPDSIEHALSFSRYLQKRFSKPVLWAYESVNSVNYTTAGQASAIQDVFKYRAALMAHDVKMFGNFWLFPDPSYPGESLIDASNVQRPAFSTWKTEANAVIANTNQTHSIGFVTPDQGNVLSGVVPIQWISRGRPLTASTFNLDVSLNGGAFSSVATGLAGDDVSVMNYNWDTCSVAPAPDVRLRLTCPATGATLTSGRFALKNLAATSNAQHTFESSTQGWVLLGGGSTLSVTQVNGATAFHGSGSLKVVCDFNANQNAYIENNSPGMTLAGLQRVTALIYVPFDLNPCTIPGAEITRVKIDLKDSAFTYLQSPQFLMQEGWNRVVWDMGAGAPGPVNYMKMSFYNKWGYSGNPAIYIDEIRVGGDLVYTGATCGTPSFTLTASPSFSLTPSRTATATPSNTGTPTATSTSTATPTNTATSTVMLPSATNSITPTRTSTATFSATGTPTSSSTLTASFTNSATPTAILPSSTPSATSTVTVLVPSSTPSSSSTTTVVLPSFTASSTSTVTVVLPSSTPSSTGTVTVVLPSSTPSFTGTVTVVLPSPTATSTSTVSSTATPSATETASVTSTESPVLSATPSLVNSVTVTMTPSAAPSSPGPVNTATLSSPGSVAETLAALNPQSGNGLQIAVNCSGTVDRIELRVYTTGYQLVATAENVGPWGPGWHRVAFDTPSLANGLYFYLVSGFNGQNPAGLPRRGKVVVLH